MVFSDSLKTIYYLNINLLIFCRHTASFDDCEMNEGNDCLLVFALYCNPFYTTNRTQGGQWLSGRVLDSRPKGRGFEHHRCHCVVVLEQDTFFLVA